MGMLLRRHRKIDIIANQEKVEVKKEEDKKRKNKNKKASDKE